MSIDEKLALLKYSKMELRHLLNEDKYLEIDFIADELGVNKKDVLEAIKNIVSEKGKQKYNDIIEIAKKKATAYHCRTPYFIIREEK